MSLGDLYHEENIFPPLSMVFDLQEMATGLQRLTKAVDYTLSQYQLRPVLPRLRQQRILKKSLPSSPIRASHTSALASQASRENWLGSFSMGLVLPQNETQIRFYMKFADQRGLLTWNRPQKAQALFKRSCNLQTCKRAGD
jgi:hypothetical protein